MLGFKIENIVGPASRLRLYTNPRLYRDAVSGLVSPHFATGSDVETLERRVSQLTGKRYAIAMPMARVGIYLAIRHLIEPGQKVLLSPYTIADVINMVICAGGVPVFADIDRKSCNIAPESISRLIDEDTGAVLVTHFYGQTAEIEKIKEICEPHRVPIIEDAAQAFGAEANGVRAGGFGHAGVFSFGMFKNVNSFYGGMLVTDDPVLTNKIRTEMANWPFESRAHLGSKVISSFVTDLATWPPLFRTLTFRLFRWAFLNDISSINNKLKIDVDPRAKTELPKSYEVRFTPLQARMIIPQLDDVERHTSARIRAAERYYEELSDIPELLVPSPQERQRHVFWYYPVQYHDRAGLVAHCMRQGRDITMSYHRNCAALDCFSQYGADCPNADATANSLIYLPTYPRYGEKEIEGTIKAIRSYFGR